LGKYPNWSTTINGVTGCGKFSTAAVELVDVEPTLEKLALHAMGATELAVEELELERLLTTELTELDTSLEFATLLEGVGSGELPPPPPQATSSPLTHKQAKSFVLYLGIISGLLIIVI
jgi:hypothetical protein